jgi:two-component system, cell cycle response regulator DivK
MTAPLILIVEDNGKNRKLLRDVLQVKGYRTVDIDTGEEGIVLARRLEPDLILMDILLPGMDGIETLVRLRADVNTRDIPVIAVTASAMEKDRLKIKLAGFDGYQSKPVSIKALLENIEELLERSRRMGRNIDKSGEDPCR